MNRTYTTLLTCLCVGAIVAQTNAPSTRHTALKERFTRTTAQHQLPNYSGDRVVIWQNDFSTPSDWTIGNLSDSNNDNWVIGTAIPTGAFAIPGIMSTTAANGFALFDSDLLCGGTQNAYVQMASPVDISAYPGAVIQFEQYYRKFEGQCFVEVSNNGTDWTAFEVNASLAVNAATPNPQLVSVNISSVAGSQTTVWVRFRYTGGCDYAWMVDDVTIIDLPDNDLIMNSAYLSHTGDPEEYCRIPTGQLLSTFSVGGTFENFGSTTQTNVTVLMEMRNAANAVVVTATATVPSLAGSSTADMDEVVNLPALANGVYTATFTVSSDQSAGDATPADNVYKRSFQVNDDLFSMDGVGNHPAGYEALTSLGTASFAGGEDGFIMMTQYNITSNVMVYGIEFDITATSEAGAAVTVAMRDTADVLATVPNVQSPLAESDIYALTAADITTGIVRLQFVVPIELTPGAYYAGVEMFSNGNTADVAIIDDLTVPEPDIASVVYISGNNVFTNGNAAAIRMITDPTIGVNELEELAGISIFPNPSTGLFRINAEVYDVYTVEVMNALGEIVLSRRINGNAVIDMTGEAQGLYTVRVSNAKASTVQRITLN